MVESSSLMTPISSGSVVQRVIDKITDAIISGELKPGDKLPTEMEMVETFKVGRNSIREAIRTLVAYGVVEIRRPEGTFVSSGFSEKMINPLLYSIIMQKEDSYKDLVGLRQIIETGVINIILQNGISDGEAAKLEKMYLQLAEKIGAENYDVEDIADRDMEFHKAIAEATHNSLVIMIHNLVAELTRESRTRTIKHIFEEDDRAYLIQTHRELLNAIRGMGDISLDKAIENSYFYWKNSYNW